MANAADAELLLKLYDLRREKTLREARTFVIFEFQPQNLEELDRVARANPFWRQAVTYWEMAASLVLRGALDADLFFDSNGEGISIYAKYHHLYAEREKESGNPFMPHTAALVSNYPAAKQRYETVLRALGRTM